MTVNTTWDQDTLTFSFEKRMDSKNSLEIEANINAIIKEKQATKIVFDLNNVEYIASAFLRICISIIKQAGKENFAIINTQPQVQKVFKISGLDEFFDIS